MQVALIAALGRNGVIGDGQALPWHLPNDLKRFRQLTLGKPIIMGRKTFASLGKPLPGRDNIILTRQDGFTCAGVEVARSVEEALTVAERALQRSGGDEVMVIGGGEVYRLFAERARLLYLTFVDAAPVGATMFPLELLTTGWRTVREETVEADAKNAHQQRYVVLERENGACAAESKKYC